MRTGGIALVILTLILAMSCESSGQVKSGQFKRKKGPERDNKVVLKRVADEKALTLINSEEIISPETDEQFYSFLPTIDDIAVPDPFALLTEEDVKKKEELLKFRISGWRYIIPPPVIGYESEHLYKNKIVISKESGDIDDAYFMPKIDDNIFALNKIEAVKTPVSLSLIKHENDFERLAELINKKDEIMAATGDHSTELDPHTQLQSETAIASNTPVINNDSKNGSLDTANSTKNSLASQKDNIKKNDGPVNNADTLAKKDNKSNEKVVSSVDLANNTPKTDSNKKTISSQPKEIISTMNQNVIRPKNETPYINDNAISSNLGNGQRENANGKPNVVLKGNDNLQMRLLVNKRLNNDEIAFLKSEAESSNIPLDKIENINVNESELKTVYVRENDEFIISIDKPGAIINKLDPKLVKMLERRANKQNTVFSFSTLAAGSVSIVFIRYDDDTNTLVRIPYEIKIKPRKLFKEPNSDSTLVENGDGLTVVENTPERELSIQKSLGDDLFSQRKYGEARVEYKKVLEKDKSNPEILYKLGVIEAFYGNNNDSYNYFTKALNEKNNPYYGETLAEIVDTLKQQRKYQEGIETFYKYAIRDDLLTNGTREKLYLLLPELYVGMKDFTIASSEYRRFLENYPNSANSDKALFYLAYCLENFKVNPDFRESKRLYEQLIKQYPESRYRDKSKERVLHIDRHYLLVN